IQDSAATQITALFPAELLAGNYTLKVFNSVGAAQSDVRILQGEPGDPKTAAEVLTLIKEVDGTGSGLDADLLDGLNSTDFVRSNGGNIAGDVSVDGALSLSGNLDADSASFSGSVKGVPRGRNLINWTDHIDKWEIVEGNPVVSLSTDSVEGATSFEFKDDTATSGTTALYGDYIAVDPGRHYVGRLQAKLLTGPGTGTFSAGYAAYDENKDPIPGTVDGDNYHFFMASDIVLVSGAAWQTFRSSDRFVVATAVLPADARFIRPLIKANTFAGSGTGTTLVDSMEIYETDGRTHSLGGKFIKLYEYDSANNPVVISPHLNICATSNSHIGCVDFQMVGAPHNTGAYTYSTGPKAIIWMTGNLVMDFKTTDAGVYLAISYTGAPAELNYSIRIASSHEIWPVAVSNIPTASTIYNVGKLN
ncbi:hypothetical protein KAI87_16505, partial [Myxococcota bacterium]|nr:hypothetical protein [Myxococcota bacterium]